MEKPTNKKSKALKILGIFGITILVLIIAVVGVFFYYKNSNVEITPVSVNPKNTEVYQALVAGLIDDPLVDVQQNKVVVAYTITADQRDKEQFMLYYTLGAVESILPNLETAEVIHYLNDKPTTYTVALKDVSDYKAGKLTDDEFNEKIQKSA